MWIVKKEEHEVQLPFEEINFLIKEIIRTGLKEIFSCSLQVTIT